MGEMLYGLLVHQGYSVVFYEKIVKVKLILMFTSVHILGDVEYTSINISLSFPPQKIGRSKPLYVKDPIRQLFIQVTTYKSKPL